jgi:hypothetical protein
VALWLVGSVVGITLCTLGLAVVEKNFSLEELSDFTLKAYLSR